ncbi:MAG: hypothetical protein JW900_09300 [Anaerolineae bacterium]|nr:hypothetical protein [Anaerolineae bacterium]
MADSSLIADCIRVDVSGFFTTQHWFQSEAGELGQLTLPAWRREGLFQSADGQEWTAQRPKWWRREHELHRDGLTVARSQPRGFFSRQILVQFEGRGYVLERISFWKRGWRLLDPSGMALLEIRPQGLFKRGALLAVLGEVDAGLLVFCYYLVYLSWQEETTVAATAAAS